MSGETRPDHRDRRADGEPCIVGADTEQVLFTSRNRGLVLIGILFLGCGLWGVGSAADGGGAMVMVALAVGGAWLIPVGWNSSVTVLPNRLEFVTWTGRRVVLRFVDIAEVRLREGEYGRAKMRIRTRTGKTFSWNANSNETTKVDSFLRVLYHALVDAGVDIDSRNLVGTGPFTLWLRDWPPAADKVDGGQ